MFQMHFPRLLKETKITSKVTLASELRRVCVMNNPILAPLVLFVSLRLSGFLFCTGTREYAEEELGMSSGRHRLRVHVEEDHNDVLLHILNGVGSKLLPLAGNAILHLDAHPDLLLPRSLTQEEASSKRTLIDAVSIENWIMPCAFLGIIDKIVWVCSPWSSQISPGTYVFHVGCQKDIERVRLTCPEPYFASEGVLCRREQLSEDTSKEVKLLVVRSDDEALARKVPEFLNEDDLSLILDIDLDFFSTKNPFLDLYPESGLYDRLSALYAFSPLPEAADASADSEEVRINFAVEASTKRAKLLDQLEDVFSHLSSGKRLDDYEEHGHWEDTNLLARVRDLVDAVEARAEGTVDWDAVHRAGCTCDDTPLPHHVSDWGEIDAMIARSEAALVAPLAHAVKLVTVARSSLDEFCPSDQVGIIQDKVLEMLKRRLPDIEESLGYQDP